MRTSHRQSGFTMVEMMVVIGIIGILSVLAIPSMTNIMPRIRLYNNTMILSNEIAVARMRAISKSSDFRIIFDVVNDSYRIEKNVMTAIGPPATWEWKSLGTTNMNGTDLLSVTGFSPSPTIMMTSAMGEINVPLNSQAYIVLQEPVVPPEVVGASQKRITVESLGRMKVERRRGGAAAWGED